MRISIVEGYIQSKFNGDVEHGYSFPPKEAFDRLLAAAEEACPASYLGMGKPVGEAFEQALSQFRRFIDASFIRRLIRVNFRPVNFSKCSFEFELFRFTSHEEMTDFDKHVCAVFQPRLAEAKARLVPPKRLLRR
jgi:hypothetical protein